MSLKKNIIVIVILIIISITSKQAQSQNIVPLPNSVEWKNETLSIQDIAVITLDNLTTESAYLVSKLNKLGYNTNTHPTSKNTITLNLSKNSKVKESYILNVSKDGIAITGSDKAGVFYGAISLLQLIDTYDGKIPCMKIEDTPRYHWRGFMLDEARHFFGIEKVKQILDLMAYFKLNKFHWHLTDSEGWRIEIKKYPKLAEIGGRGYWSDLESDELNYYTQEQIKEIVAYAAARHIEVIPEVDMPGHANAALKAYPQYSGGSTEQYGEFTYNPGKEETYQFLANILKEVKELFPSQYMHIGGDEVAFGIESWNTDNDAQALIHRKGFTNLRQAEKYFIDRMSDTVRSLERKLIGWEELVELEADTSTTIMWWRQNKPEVLDRALTLGYKTILCPRLPCYLDFIQDKNHKWGRVWTGNFNRLQGLYTFPDDKITAADISAMQKQSIIGIQANMWTERVPSSKRLDFMIWPRLCALAESAWTQPANKDFVGFEQRMSYIYTLFDKIGIYYYDHRNPSHHIEVPGRERGEVKREKPMTFID